MKGLPARAIFLLLACIVVGMAGWVVAGAVSNRPASTGNVAQVESTSAPSGSIQAGLPVSITTPSPPSLPSLPGITSPYLLSGDVTFDCRVDIYDLAAVAAGFGAMRGDPAYNPDADIDGNAVINIFDLVGVGIRFGLTFPGAP